MKRKLLFVFGLMGYFGFSQTPTEKIQNYINENKDKLHLNSSEVNQWVIQSETSSETTGITNYLVMQTYNGVKIDTPNIYFWIKNGAVINTPEGFISDVSAKVNTTSPALNVVQGFSAALTKLNEPTISSSILEQSKNKYKLSNGALTEDPVTAELVLVPNQSGNLVLAWKYEFYTQDGKHLWNAKIDATNGNLIEKRDLVINCTFGPKHNHHANESITADFSTAMFKETQTNALLTPGTTNYRVIPWNYESPIHSSRQLITNPEATTVLAPATLSASPNGWHNASTTIGATSTTYAYTRGNNAFAYSDYTNTNPTNPTTYANASTGTYPNLTFDYAYGGDGVAPTSYINAAITNLFYQNNIMHDLWYQYGFNEANRNFQAANFGRGGSGSDAVNAEAQDASQSATPSLNNANFSTPGDGTKPRMQMYLWSVRQPSNLLVNTGTLAGTNYSVNDNAFSPGHVNLPLAPATLTNNLVLFDDGAPDNTDACTAATAANAAALNGKIAVIRRGSCNFVVKVKFAQTAGAIGAIVVNNAAGGISMAGADATITIPAVSMSQADGEALIAAMGSGTVNVSLSSPQVYVNGDGDFDNGVISHEFTHGISTRLVGGGAGLNSAEQPGEGWSDWAWLMMQIKPGDTRNDARGIGTYVMNQTPSGPGIREYRYSTDMSVNPHTFADTNDQWYTDTNGVDQIDVHGLGSIWCVMLWDLAWNYIDKYGYDPNIYNGTGGNNKVMRLVLDAMKLTPANPSLIQCRNAIIQADVNSTNGQNYCLIWQTFARRGMGINASSGTNGTSVSGVQDQVADFTEPTPGSTPATGSNCFLAVDQFQNQNAIRVYPNPTRGQLNIAINNYAGKLTVEVYDLNGRKVFNEKSDYISEKAINLSGLQTGVYMIKVNGDNLNYTQKIILN